MDDRVARGRHCKQNLVVISTAVVVVVEGVKRWGKAKIGMRCREGKRG